MDSTLSRTLNCVATVIPVKLSIVTVFNKVGAAFVRYIAAAESWETENLGQKPRRRKFDGGSCWRIRVTRAKVSTDHRRLSSKEQP